MRPGRLVIARGMLSKILVTSMCASQLLLVGFVLHRGADALHHRFSSVGCAGVPHGKNVHVACMGERSACREMSLRLLIFVLT